MKINVCIEAESIQEYLEAIQALAKGYVVDSAPVINAVPVTKSKVDAEKVAEVVKEEKPKRQRKADAEKQKEEVNKRFSKMEADKIEGGADIPQPPKEVEQVFSESSDTSEPKHGFPAVKLIAGKLSKIQDGKAEVKFLLDKFGIKKLSDLKEENYDEFHELASKAIADHDKGTPISEAHEKDVAETPNEAGEQKEITLEMVRGIAKQLNDQGFKEAIRNALKKFGAPNLGKLKKEDYAEFYKELMKHNG